MIVNGAYRGQEAKLTEINEKKFSCTVTLSSVSMKYFVFHSDLSIVYDSIPLVLNVLVHFQPWVRKLPDSSSFFFH